MHVSVPLDTAVYHRRNARECFVLRHVDRSSYAKTVPPTLCVSDLRRHSADACMAHAALLVLLTGRSTVIYTLANWSDEKRGTALLLG